MNKNSVTTSFSTFLDNLQQPNKNFIDTAYSNVLKEAVKPRFGRKKTPKKSESYAQNKKKEDHYPNFCDASDQDSEQIIRKYLDRKQGQSSQKEQKL